LLTTDITIYAPYVIVSKNGSKLTNLHRNGNRCDYYYRRIAKVLVWSTVHNPYRIGELHSITLIHYWNFRWIVMIP